MNYIYKKISIFFLVIFCLLGIFAEKVDVIAQEDNSVEIDVIKSIGNITNIESFNKNGFAIFSIQIGTEQYYYDDSWHTEPINNYGLIDANGTIILNAEYSNIYVYDQDKFIVSKIIKQDENQDIFTQGIYDSKLRTFVLEPIYDFIPKSLNTKMLVLTSENGLNNHFFSIRDGQINKIILPSTINISNYREMGYRKLTKDLTLMLARNSDTDRVFWIADAYGDAISDSNQYATQAFVYNNISYVITDNENGQKIYKALVNGQNTSLIEIDGLSEYGSFRYIRNGIIEFAINTTSGRYNINNQEVTPLNLSSNYPNHEIFVNSETGKKGIRLLNEEIVLPAEYIDITFNSDFDVYSLMNNKKLTNSDNDQITKEIEVYGIYIPDTKIIVDTAYSYFLDNLIRNGYALVEKSTGTFVERETGCGQSGLEPCNFTEHTFGLINTDFVWVVPAENGYIDVERKSNDDYAFYYTNTWKKGIVYLHSKTAVPLVNAEYEKFVSTEWDEYINYLEFDDNGLIKSVKIDNDIEKYGFVSRNGVEVSAEYKEVSYRDGYFYLKQFDGSWSIQKRDVPSEIITIPNFTDGKEIISINLIGEEKEYVLVETKLNDKTYFGVLNRDKSVFFDYDYTSIRLNEGLWNLEKIVNSKVYVGILNSNKEEVIPFTDKYSSLSDYNAGYSVGEGVEIEKTTYNPIIEMLNLMFIQVYANLNNSKVVDIFNVEGKIVASVGDRYESGQIIGVVNGTVRILLKNDEGYSIANLLQSNSEIPLPIVVPNSSNSTSNINDEKPVNNFLSSDKSKGKLSLSFNEKMNLLISSLYDESSMSNSEFDTLLIDINSVDPLFMQYLNQNELSLLELRIQNIFKNTFTINIESTNKLSVFNLINIINFSKLLNGSTIRLDLSLNNIISDEDTDLMNQYLEKNQLDTNTIYKLNISIFETVDGIKTELNQLNQSLKITLPIPKEFIGFKSFSIMHIHNGKVEIIPVTINDDNTFSISSDTFSSFILITNEKIVQPIVIKEKINNFYLYFIGFILILLSLFVFIKSKKVSKVN